MRFTFIFIIDIHEHGPLSSTTIVHRERRRVVGTSTRAVARAFASEPQAFQKKHWSTAAEQQHCVQKPLITSTICSWICGIGQSLDRPQQSALGSDKTLDHLNSLLRCTSLTCLRQQHFCEIQAENL